MDACRVLVYYDMQSNSKGIYQTNTILKLHVPGTVSYALPPPFSPADAAPINHYFPFSVLRYHENPFCFGKMYEKGSNDDDINKRGSNSRERNEETGGNHIENVEKLE